MRFIITAALLVSHAIHVSATGILLPLYVYPSVTSGDGAANWAPVFEAISSQPSIPWTVIVNPLNGPGDSLLPANGDPAYEAGVAALNAFSNVNTVGYVRTNYGNTPMSDIQADVAGYAAWSSAPTMSVKGIFFDETAFNFEYLSEAVTIARNAFSTPITTICNFGARAEAEFYTICDIVVAFESCLNNGCAVPYESEATLTKNIPAGQEANAAVIVHHVEGAAVDGTPASAELLTGFMATLSAKNVGWAYFTSGDYDAINLAPATVGQNAASLANGADGTPESSGPVAPAPSTPAAVAPIAAEASAPVDAPVVDAPAAEAPAADAPAADAPTSEASAPSDAPADSPAGDVDAPVVAEAETAVEAPATDAPATGPSMNGPGLTQPAPVPAANVSGPAVNTTVPAVASCKARRRKVRRSNKVAKRYTA